MHARRIPPSVRYLVVVAIPDDADRTLHSVSHTGYRTLGVRARAVLFRCLLFGVASGSNVPVDDFRLAPKESFPLSRKSPGLTPLGHCRSRGGLQGFTGGVGGRRRQGRPCHRLGGHPPVVPAPIGREAASPLRPSARPSTDSPPRARPSYRRPAQPRAENPSRAASRPPASRCSPVRSR